MSRSILARLFLLSLTVAGVMGCGVSSRLTSSLGNKYRYSISLVAPQQSEQKLYRDDRLIIQFRFDDPAIRFQAQNLSADTARFDWEHATLDLGGLRQPVRTMISFYDSAFVGGMSDPVPPMGVLRDVIAPRAGVTVRGRQWRVAELFPTMDGNSFNRETEIRGTVGRKVELSLPVRFGAEMVNYEFVFSVDSVHRIAWSDYGQPPWVPTPPPIKGVGPTSEDRIAAATIVGAFAGYLWYVMSMKKTPVVE